MMINCCLRHVVFTPFEERRDRVERRPSRASAEARGKPGKSTTVLHQTWLFRALSRLRQPGAWPVWLEPWKASAILRGRSWQSRSDDRRARARQAEGAAQPGRRASTSARSATSRSGRTACARRARRTAGAKSSRSEHRLRSLSEASPRRRRRHGRRPRARTRSSPGALGGPLGLDRAGDYGPAGLDTQGLELVEAPDTIAMHEKPVEAVRSKPKSSLVAACRAVGEGQADAVVSAGNTGATLAAGLFEIRRLPEVDRPAIAAVIPARRRPDRSARRRRERRRAPGAPPPVRRDGRDLRRGGARAPESGGAPALDRRGAREGEPARPRGPRAPRARAASTSAATSRAARLLDDAGEVVVTDGFTGNIVLKLLEGTIKSLLDALRDEIYASTRGKVGGLFIRPAARHLRERLDPDTYGGAHLLGLRGVAVIAHGNSSPRAIANAIRLAARGVEHRIVDRLSERLGAAVLASARSRTRQPRPTTSPASEVTWQRRARKSSSV